MQHKKSAPHTPPLSGSSPGGGTAYALTGRRQALLATLLWGSGMGPLAAWATATAPQVATAHRAVPHQLAHTRVATAWRKTLPDGKHQDHVGVLRLDWANRRVVAESSQAVRKRAHGLLADTSGGFLAVDSQNGTIAGYYTLSACHVLLADIDAAQTKALPRYPEIPAVQLGRLAVDAGYRQRKIGSALVFDAIQRARRLEIGACLMLVDAKDAQAADFYAHLGFKAIPGRPMQLISTL